MGGWMGREVGGLVGWGGLASDGGWGTAGGQAEGNLLATLDARRGAAVWDVRGAPARLAVAMAFHARLGAGAALARLAGLPEAMRAIADAASVIGALPDRPAAAAPGPPAA